jgi:biotin carboxyl carrier protein
MHAWKETQAGGLRGGTALVDLNVKLVVRLDGRPDVEVELLVLEPGSASDYTAYVSVDGGTARRCTLDGGHRAHDALQVFQLADSERTLQLLGRPMPGSGGGRWELQYEGALVSADVRLPRAAALEVHMPVVKELDTSDLVLSPMPGKVVSISVKAGDVVGEGQEIAVVEAMKMQNVRLPASLRPILRGRDTTVLVFETGAPFQMLRAPRAGVVKAVHHAAGATVDGDEILVEFETVEAPE